MAVHTFKQKFYLVVTKIFEQMARVKTMENWWHNQPRPSSSKDAKYNFKSRLGWLMGFRNQIYTGITSSTKITSECMYSLTGPRYLYLVVDEFTSNGNQKSFIAPLPSSVIAKHILSRITMDGINYPFMSVIPATCSNGLLLSDVRSYTGMVDIQKLNVQLVNYDGAQMNLNGADFSFCLKIEHE